MSRPAAGAGARRGGRLAAWLGLAALTASCQSPSARADADLKPLVIRAGGTYTGSYRSTDSAVPCIRVETTEPVVLRGCTLTGAGDLIRATAGGATLTVVNCRGYGLPQSADQTRHGYFLEVNSGRSVRVEHNYFERTIGIGIYQWSGDGSPAQTLTVRYNSARNIDGRYRDGGGTKANFLGLNALPGLANIEIAWNQVINEPNQSLVEDNINLYNSGGTRTSPARIHDNYIQGAYPYPANGPDFTGAGITLDGSGRAALSATAFVDGARNQVVSACIGMTIAAGHDNHFHDNRIVSCGLLPDGTRLPANYAGAGLWNAYQQPKDVFFNNDFTNNTIGFYFEGGTTPYPNRQDTRPEACSACSNTLHLPNPITLQTEQAEWTRWQLKLRTHQLRVGPVPALPARKNTLLITGATYYPATGQFRPTASGLLVYNRLLY